MSQWPEPDADPEEPRRWLGRVALAGAVGAVVVLLAASNDGFGSWALPEISLPEFELPEMPTPDLRVRSVSDTTNTPPATTDMMIGELPADGSPITRSASFEACVSTINNATQAFGQPALLEDRPDRRVALFKLSGEQLLVTCANGAITIMQYP